MRQGEKPCSCSGPGERLDDVQTLSNPTLGLLFDMAVESFGRQTELVALMMRCDLLDPMGGGDVVKVLLNNLMAARRAAEDGDRQAHRDLLRFARLIAEKCADRPQGMSQMGDLREAVLADGYQLTLEAASLLPNDNTIRCTILPTDAAPVPALLKPGTNVTIIGKISRLDFSIDLSECEFEHIAGR